jgi:hypothetical protein
LKLPAPNLCTPEYDTASGQLFMGMALTFPADLVTHAYGSVLVILREGLAIPALASPVSSSWVGGVAAQGYRIVGRVTGLLAPLGPLVVLAAVGVAWAQSVRLGIALTVFVLFLTGYPAIEFEHRHWFHLRFIPWWAMLFVGSQLFRERARGWTRHALVRATAGVTVVLLTLVVTLMVLRLVQTRRVAGLVAQYEAAPMEEIPTDRGQGSFVPVRWQPLDFGSPPAHRGSDLLVVTLDDGHCGGADPLTVRVRYDSDAPSHDLSTAFVVPRPKPGSAATRLFIPVFSAGFQDHSYLRFSGFEIVGAAPACLGRVARVVEGAPLPLWVAMQVPPDWATQRLYQAIAPRWRHR